MDPIPQRRRLYHAPPVWVRNDAKFFVTVGCARRGPSQLDRPAVFHVITAAIEHYLASEKWWLDIFLAMPDHWHALASFRDANEMAAILRDWKRFVSKRTGVIWQDGFFDHRLRTQESANETWHYIRLNPVTKGLVAEPEEWRYVWMPRG